jgi:hypothetical protein
MVPLVIQGQEIDYDSLLQRIDTVENPVYKPVVSFSYGVMNFHGDVKNSYNSPAVGNHAGKLNVSTFVDRQHHFVANFSLILGRLSGNEYSHSDITRNLNFQTGLYSFGLNLEYRFGHFLPATSLVRPYVSLGVESINFSSKGDLKNADGVDYHYWTDGTIRDVDETLAGASNIIYRDYQYETDLRLRELEDFGLGDYNQRSLGIPAGLGVHFRIDQRAFFSLGMSYHYAFTDVLDNVAHEGTSIVGKRGNDSYIFSHVSLHFDLFSDPTTRTVDLMFADVEFDPLFFDDEDGDFVLDVSDHCPGTPYGVEVDTLGCPLDGDRDGIPDYLDQELDTPPGAWVNELGETVTGAEFDAVLAQREQAMARANVEAYLDMIRGDYRVGSSAIIPDRFKSLDENEDGYISFDELLRTIDQYFDYQLDLSLEELRQVNEFFFSQ